MFITGLNTATIQEVKEARSFLNKLERMTKSHNSCDLEVEVENSKRGIYTDILRFNGIYGRMQYMTRVVEETEDGWKETILAYPQDCWDETIDIRDVISLMKTFKNI